MKDTRVEVLWGEENREYFKKYVGKRFSGKILGKGTSKKFIEKSWKIEWDDTDEGKFLYRGYHCQNIPEV